MSDLASMFAPQGAQGQSIDAIVAQKLGLDPTLPRRPTILPVAADAQGHTVAALPQIAVDLAKFFMLPGHAAGGGAYAPQDVTQAAMLASGLRGVR